MPWPSIVTWGWSKLVRTGAAARADPTPGPAAESDPCRVLEDVLDDRVEMGFALDHAGLESALEEVAAALVAPVEPHRIHAVQPLHSAGELGLSRLDEQVEVIVEQVPGMHCPAETPLDVDEELEPGLAVEIVQHNRSLVHTAADDVVPGRARQLAARSPRHGVDAISPAACAKPA
jgi:hypothetical protein